jgi:hypothetical protein
MTKKFEIPLPYSIFGGNYEFDKFIQFLKKYKENIDSIYFPIGFLNKDEGAFGIRSVDGITVESVEGIMSELFQEIKVPYKVLINDIYNKFVLDNPKVAIEKLNYYQNQCEIKSVVIADFTIGTLLGTFAPEYNFCLSTNAYRTFNELLQTLLINGDGINITEIIVNRDINRDHETIAMMKKNKLLKDKQLIFMLNEGCVLNCPYRESGDVEISLNVGEFNIHHHGCSAIKQREPWLFLTAPFLTRGMLDEEPYVGHVYKLAGRNKNTAYLRKIFEYFLEDGDLRLSEYNNLNQIPEVMLSSLDEHPSFVKEVIECDKVCANCRKCSTFYEEIRTNK